MNYGCLSKLFETTTIYPLRPIYFLRQKAILPQRVGVNQQMPCIWVYLAKTLFSLFLNNAHVWHISIKEISINQMQYSCIIAILYALAGLGDPIFAVIISE